MNTDEPHRIGQRPAPVDRRAARIAAAEQALASAHSSMRSAGVDPDSIATVFAVARDCLAEARELSAQARRELALAQYERELARRQASVLYPPPGPFVMPDLPGTDLCPDPCAARTPAEFMDALREFRMWAGKPSFRAMERQCARRFAASTMCTALRGSTLPSLDMVHAIVSGCGGSPRHVHAFATAWRRLAIPRQQDMTGRQAMTGHQQDRPRGLYSVGGTA
jgi:hypothetical protein